MLAMSPMTDTRREACSIKQANLGPMHDFAGLGVCPLGIFVLRNRTRADGRTVKLTITHVMDRADSKLIEAVSGGWPRILSNLKSLLETGEIVISS